MSSFVVHIDMGDGSILEVTYNLAGASQPLFSALSEGMCPHEHENPADNGHLLFRPQGSYFAYCPEAGMGYQVEMVEEKRED